MATPKLVSARWCKNRGVMLGYALGSLRSRQFVPSSGRLTIGQATTLLGLTHTRLHRLHRSKRVKVNTRGPVATIKLTELRRLRVALRSS